MPSNLRSKIQLGPAKRSWVSVAAIGSIPSGIVIGQRLRTTAGVGRSSIGEGAARVQQTEAVPRGGGPRRRNGQPRQNQMTAQQRAGGRAREQGAEQRQRERQ